ncbi:MAG: c-type cytochrome biogenesis protein CcsB [Candidatus Firestonebacteria bacterium]|nr:c-type cytochrome biogenesis protein CcsB [Candidatus Firestonebacteria bacterium]
MSDFSIIFLLISSVLYFIGFMFYLIAFSHRRENLFKYGNYIAWSAIAIHTCSIIFRGIAAGYFPITRLYETLSFFSWCIVLLFLILNYSYELRIMGLLILPFSFICLGYALMVPKTMTPLAPVLRSKLFEIHIIIAFLSYASFVIAFVTGLIYLFQERKIKSKSKSMWHYHLPSLEVVDEVNYRSIIFGFPLFTLSIIIGVIWAQQVIGSYWNWDPKEVTAFVTWLIYAIQLHTRIASGWRGRKTAILSIIGFLVVLFSYLGLHYLGLGFHTYG